MNTPWKLDLSRGSIRDADDDEILTVGRHGNIKILEYVVKVCNTFDDLSKDINKWRQRALSAETKEKAPKEPEKTQDNSIVEALGKRFMTPRG